MDTLKSIICFSSNRVEPEPRREAIYEDHGNEVVQPPPPQPFQSQPLPLDPNQPLEMSRVRMVVPTRDAKIPSARERVYVEAQPPGESREPAKIEEPKEPEPEKPDVQTILAAVEAIWKEDRRTRW